MALIIFFLSALLIVRAITGVSFGLGRVAPGPVAKPLLTDREAAMLLVLEELLPTARIHAQVAMGALLRAPPAPGRRTLSSDRNYFSQKIVDFVI
ncbi:hypothetical protein [Sphingomonas sp. MA1305]|uniref:hypothetical protein n=1 Tax=Sphingomonas sp. MA1305 TaxID=2479204 RepID=UPI001E5C5BD4|nr:hypothetical protein [Sphingomonas sp. MA1305]